MPRSAAERLVSLDAFRGFAIAGMVLVNNAGDWEHVYRQLDHAEWNGWTFTDWVFPFFLFVCGVAMVISLERRRAAGEGRAAVVRQLARRAAIIFAIGLVLNLIPAFDLATVRIPGVLQRIALCIVIAAPIVVYGDWRRQAGWIVALLAAYTGLMLFVPVPDAQGQVAAGVLEPGRDVGAFVDRMVLGGHLWSRTKTWDPEGLVSTLPAVCSLLFGALAGRWLGAAGTPARKTVGMLLAGLACLGLGALLDVVLMPINKNLWTTSYCIFMTGWAPLLFAAFFWLIDGSGSPALRDRSRRLLQPFTIYGMNALFIFALSGLVARLLLMVRFAQEGGGTVSLKALLYAPLKALPLAPVDASLLYAILFNAAMFALAWWMWRKRWFVTV